MKNKIKVFGKNIDCEHRELFALNGVARYSAIQHLSVIAPELICSFYKDCNICPLFLKNEHGRNLCADVASDREVYESILNGGHFVTLKESENENS